MIPYYSSLLIFILLAIFYHPFFYAYILSYFVIRSEVLASVLEAIWNPRYQIILTWSFLIMVIYSLSLLSYWHFHSYYEQKTCDNLLTCVMVNIDQTFKNDGGIGSYLSNSYELDDSQKVHISYYRIIFDNIFNFIVLMLIVELLGGIIIDKFSELREANEKQKEEMNNSCFICG